MPLRVLLLLPDGEQPSISRTPGQKSNAKSPKSPILHSFKAPPSPSSGASSPLSNDYRSKPLPSPPPVNVDATNRASNQTHLTLPSTSGSSAGSSSRSTEDVPSPPLSPDPTASFNSGASFTSPNSPTGSFADITVRGLKLNPNKPGNRRKPVLRINTKLPRTVRYISESTEHGSASEEEEIYGDGGDINEYLEVGMIASTSRPQDDGAATARKAVDDRLQHLLATTRESLSRISLGSRASNVPSSPIPRSPLDSVPPPHPSLPSLHPPTQKQPSISHQKPSHRRRLRHLNSSTPPRAPTRALPPYKIFGPQDVVPLDVISDPRRARKVPVRSGGWGRTGVLIQSTRSLKPKGAKGKYIRLLTLPPLPAPKTAISADVEEDEIPDLASLVHDRGRRKGKGRLPTVLIENEEEEEESEETKEGDLKTKRRDKEVPTVYMTELVSNQWDRPVPCMMWPPPVPPSSASRPSSRPGSFSSTRPISSLSRMSTSTSTSNQILNPQTSAYQLPLPTLTPLQKSSLHNVGLLVYAVPKGYTGAVPPAECLRVGEEVQIREEEVVGPWATAQIPTLHSLQTSGEVGVPSPRASIFGLASPARSPLSGNVITAGSSGSGGALPGSLSPRWPTEGLGLWSRAKGGSGAGSKRGSTASTMSGVESPAHSRPASGVIQNAVEDKSNDGAHENTTSAGGWSSSFSSIRAKAQGYYAKESSTNPTPASPSPGAALSTSKSETLSTESSSGASSVPMSRGISSTIGASRSFGSLFLRTTSSSNTPTSAGDGTSSSVVTPSTAGLAVPDSGYGSSPGTGNGKILFEYAEPPRDGEVVKVEIIETDGGGEDGTENAPVTKGWKLGGWGARWGG